MQDESCYVRVAVAVILNNKKQVLIAKRHAHVHQGGLWEFPGGKQEQDESILDTLNREINEELNINVLTSKPLIKIRYSYPDKNVLLDVWKVTSFSGTAEGNEGQEVQWVDINKLRDFCFPEANIPILNSLMLSDTCMITDQYESISDYMSAINKAVDNKIQMIQLRAHHFSAAQYFELVKQVSLICKANNVMLIFNTSPEIFHEYGLDKFGNGLHVRSSILIELSERPVTGNQYLSSSIHNDIELVQANSLGLDFALISPVYKTKTHPESEPLGWNKFSLLANKANFPVYGLGGMNRDDILTCQSHGGQGIAGIRLFT